MSATVASASALTHGKTLRSGSQSAQAALAGLRAGDRCARMSAKTDRATVVSLLRAVLTDTGTSQKVLAVNAEVPESVISDALNPQGQRHFALEWLCDQDDAVVLAFVQELMRARGLTPASKREVVAERIGELVRLLIQEAA